MTSQVHIVFDVDDSPEAKALTWQQLYDLAELFITHGPDLEPPVLTFAEIKIVVTPGLHR